MEAFRYGVLRVGESWVVTDDSGMRIGFPLRSAAMAALASTFAAHRATGRSVMVTIHEEGGRLRTLFNPPYHLLLTPVANDAASDVRTCFAQGESAKLGSLGPQILELLPDDRIAFASVLH